MSIFARLTRLARSPQGKRLMRQAGDYARSPQGRKQLQRAMETAKSRRSGKAAPKKRARG